MKIKQYDILHEANEYLSNPLKIILDAYKIKKILQTLNIKSKLHITVEPYALFVPFIKNDIGKIFLTLHGSYFFKLQKNFISSFLFKKAIKSINKIVFVSNYTKKKFIENCKKLKRLKHKRSLTEFMLKKGNPKRTLMNLLKFYALVPLSIEKDNLI